MAENIKQVPSEVLAAHVVAYRSLKINKELAISAMVELATRRENGSEFDYESYIDEKLKIIEKVRKEYENPSI